MTGVDACDACLRRTDLIAALAGVARRRVAPRGGARRGVLALPDEELLALDRTRPAPRAATRASTPAPRARADRGAGLAARLPLRRRLPGAACASSPTRRRCCTSPATRRRSTGRRRVGDRRRPPRHRRTGSRSPARSAAAWPRPACRSSPGWRSASTRPRTPARSRRRGADRSPCWPAAPTCPYPASQAAACTPQIARARLRRLRAAARLQRATAGASSPATG